MTSFAAHWVVLALSLGLSSACSSAATGEEAYYSGVAAPSVDGYLKVEQAKMLRSFSLPESDHFQFLPKSVDLSAGLPYAGNQGRQNSCVGWVTSFAIKSFQENREFGWGLGEKYLFSPSFVYNQLNEGKDEGIDLREAMAFMVKNGTAPFGLMPYEEKDFTSKPPPEALRVALGFKALGYRRIDEGNVPHIKSYLASGEPVAMVIEISQNFLKKGMVESHGLYKEKKGEVLGYHALVAVGYDDSKKAVKVLNSWGREWGKDGYGWISYELLPQISKQAYIIYDTPTLPRFATLLRNEGGQDAGKGPFVTQKASATGTQAAADSDSLLVVPDEGGIFFKGKWLRLGGSMSEAGDFLKTAGVDMGEIRVEKDYLGKDVARKIEFYPARERPVYTHQGITFGMSRKDVHRIYRKPDLIQAQDETYFYHSVAENWGGLTLTRQLSLGFHYDPDGNVSYMVLDTVFKDIVMKGNDFTPFAVGEKTASAGVTRIASPDGRVAFDLPALLSDVNKSDWGKGGYGYFAKNPADPLQFMIFRLFDAGRDVDEAMLGERIRADAAAAGIEGPARTVEKFAGLDWTVVSTPTTKRYYAPFGRFYGQVFLSSSKAISGEEWVGVFLKSLSMRGD